MTTVQAIALPKTSAFQVRWENAIATRYMTFDWSGATYELVPTISFIHDASLLSFRVGDGRFSVAFHESWLRDKLPPDFAQFEFNNLSPIIARAVFDASMPGVEQVFEGVFGAAVSADDTHPNLDAARILECREAEVGTARLYLVLDEAAAQILAGRLQTQSIRPGPRLSDELSVTLHARIGSQTLGIADFEKLKVGSAILLPRDTDLNRVDLLAGWDFKSIGLAEADQDILTITEWKVSTLQEDDYDSGETEKPAEPEASDAPDVPERPISAETPVGEIELRLDFVSASTSFPIAEIAKFGPGSTIPLNKPASSEVDVYVSGKKVARAELIDIDGILGARIISTKGPLSD